MLNFNRGPLSNAITVSDEQTNIRVATIYIWEKRLSLSPADGEDFDLDDLIEIVNYMNKFTKEYYG